MRRKIGILLMIVGLLLLLGALIWFLMNQKEAKEAGEASASVLSQMQEIMAPQKQENLFSEKQKSAPLTKPGTQLALPQDAQSIAEMAEIEIDGYGYIGYLSIPILELELPVMSDWDYTRLQIAPCRQFGSTFTDDLVIAGHNYWQHFGNLKNLAAGDEVIFSDVNDESISYQVVSLEILQPTDVADVENSIYDLILYTCTYDLQTRVVVGCNRIS